MAMTEYNKNFRFIKDEYTARSAQPPNHFRKKVATDRNDLRGKTCPSCGLKRSMMNKCDCNS